MCIGVDGYPKYVIIGGDQQTYSIMKNLKIKYSDHYEWMYPVPGDWHVMKTAAEVIKNVLYDGGFKQFSAKCGHKGEITQWQDIHNVLTACHAALLRLAVQEFHTIKQGNICTSKVWIDGLTTKQNSEVTQFWCQMLIYLQAYVGFYFSIRSGNWLLRTSCLKKLNELFFAYSRDKYEVLGIHTLADTYTYPDEVLKQFQKGQWTVSAKGRPYHNLALDEAHECIINRKLKQITTRPSYFRMVELSDFMSYLDSVVSGLDSHVFKYYRPSNQVKNSTCIRANLIYDFIKTKGVFCSTGNKTLCNIFVDSPPQLAVANVQDLLQISKKGKEHMLSYIRQYILEPPTELRQKRTRQKLKTFTKTKNTTTRLNTRLKQATLLLSSAYRGFCQRLQTNFSFTTGYL